MEAMSWMNLTALQAPYHGPTYCVGFTEAPSDHVVHVAVFAELQLRQVHLNLAVLHEHTLLHHLESNGGIVGTRLTPQLESDVSNPTRQTAGLHCEQVWEAQTNERPSPQSPTKTFSKFKMWTKYMNKIAMLWFEAAVQLSPVSANVMICLQLIYQWSIFLVVLFGLIFFFQYLRTQLFSFHTIENKVRWADRHLFSVQRGTERVKRLI